MNIRNADSPITLYIQHPIPIPAPGDKNKPTLKPLKLTKKEQEMCISDYVLYSRLKNIQLDLFLIDLDKFTLDKTISRDFMSDRYGGSNIACFPTIGREKLEHHGRDNFMYMNMRYHPHAPQVPGAPGLYTRFRTSDIHDRRVHTSNEGGILLLELIPHLDPMVKVLRLRAYLQSDGEEDRASA